MSAPELQLKLAQPARNDLANLLSYTLQRWGEAQLLEYEAKIHSALTAITKNPQLGRERHGLLMIQAGRHRIFYRLQNTTVLVLRILHERMDADRHLPH